ncbi:MAG: hypothetical protein U1E78_05185 [Gammaproteobacteria bacterium]
MQTINSSALANISGGNAQMTCEEALMMLITTDFDSDFAFVKACTKAQTLKFLGNYVDFLYAIKEVN